MSNNPDAIRFEIIAKLYGGPSSVCQAGNNFGNSSPCDDKEKGYS